MKPQLIIFICLLSILSCKKNNEAVVDNQDTTSNQNITTPKRYPIVLSGPRDPIIIDFNNDNNPDFQLVGRQSHSGYYGSELKIYIVLLNNDFSFSGKSIQDTLYTDTVQVNYQGYQVNQIKHHNEPNGQNIVAVNPVTLITIYDSTALQSATYAGVTGTDGIVVNSVYNNGAAPHEISIYKRGERKNGYLLFRHLSSNVIYKVFIDKNYVYAPELL